MKNNRTRTPSRTRKVHLSARIHAALSTMAAASGVTIEACASGIAERGIRAARSRSPQVR